MLDGWQSPQIKEVAVLFDFSVLIPCLYVICYWAKGKMAFVRFVALACLGIWIAGHIVPDSHHDLISRAGMLRNMGLFVLIAIELRLGIEVYKLAIKSKPESVTEAVRERAEKEGIPPWVAKVMAAEARFWRKLVDVIRGPFQR
jgi:hypothetical protein